MKIKSFFTAFILTLAFCFSQVALSEEVHVYEPLMLENTKFNEISFDMSAASLSARGFSCNTTGCTKNVDRNHALSVYSSNDHIYKITSVLNYDYAADCSELTRKLASVFQSKYPKAFVTKPLYDVVKTGGVGYKQTLATSGGLVDIGIMCKETSLNSHSITTVYYFTDATVYDYKKNIQ